MGFLDDLKTGRPGLRFQVPAAFQVSEDRERRVLLVDNERRVGWHVAHAPWRLDLRPEYAAELRRDIERTARQRFVDQHAQLAEKDAGLAPPRTDDPSFSPLISIEHVRIGAAPALVVLRRLAHQPGLEVVLGSVLVPLGTGFCEIAAFHRGAESGLPLTLVRAALRWLLALPPEALAVTAPAPAPPAGPLELQAAECAIVPPPRYLLLPAGSVPIPATMQMLTRVLLEASDSPMMLDVWHFPEPIAPVQQQGRPERQQQLLGFVQQNAEEWKRQGATEVQLDVKALERDCEEDFEPGRERIYASAEVRMRVNGLPTHSISHWLADGDGAVYRVTVGAPAYVPLAELRADLEGVLRSFRRLEAPPRTGWLTSDLRLRPTAAG